MNKYKNNSNGFTLIELLLYTAIVGSLLIAIVAFLMLAIDSRVKNQTISEVDQQGIAVIEQITRAVRNANSISTPAQAANGSLLSLNTSAGTIIFNESLGVIQIQEGASAAIALTNSKVQITNLQFNNLSRSGTKGIVKVSFTISRINTSGKNVYDYQKTFTTSVAVGQ